MRFIPILTGMSLFAALASAQGTWYVNPTGLDTNDGLTPATAFQTVNHAAVVATAGDVLRLAAGTYGNEQGNILLGTKTLTLVGAGVGATVVKAHSTSDLMLPAGLLVGTTIEAHRVAITLNGTARVDIRDLTIDQGFFMPSTGRGYCLWVGGGADTQIDNVEFTNARTNPINGIQGPLAVNIRGDNAGDATNVTLRNCYVHDYGKGGVVANFNANLTMDACRVRGYGHAALGLAAQNAIQVSRGANCDIRRTQVNDSWYEPDTVTATGILFFEAGTVLVEDCTFGNCQAGIYSFAQTPQTAVGNIRRNVIHASEYGMTMQGVSGYVIADNVIHVSLAGDTNDAYDDASPPNTWTGNSFSAISTPGAYAIFGGTAVDATAKPSTPSLGSQLVTTLPGGNAPIDMVVASLDADSDPDFATLCQGSSSSLVVGINTGGLFSLTTTTFGAPSTASNPMAIVAGEFNGAAGRDLAVVTQNVPPALTENKVFVFANSGTGTFSLLHTHTIAGATAPSGIAAGDVDGDGKDDLVVTDAGAFLSAGSATLLRNNGSGTGFTASALPGAFTAACRDAAVARLDAGATADIAVVEGDATQGRVHVFTGDGLGGFTAAGVISLSVNANSVLATDLEGDGDQDLLVSCSRDALSLGVGEVAVLNNGGAANFALAQYRTERGPTAMAAGDIGADADEDTQRRDVALVDFAGSAVTLLGNYVAGSGFTTGGIVATGTLATGVGIGDVNGDGYGDLLWCDAAAGTVTVALGVIQARTDFYGAGCAGTSGRVPHLAALGIPALPTLPNPTFGLSMTNARPFSVVVFAAGSGALPVTPCGLLISSIDQTWFAVSNAVGSAAVAVPVPNTPVFLGITVWLQGGVFDPAGGAPILPGLALTQGMKLRVGS